MLACIIMSTRNGVPYQPGQTQPDLEAMIRTLTESMTKLSQDMNEGFAQFRDRAQVLEEPRHRNWTPDSEFGRPQPHPHLEPRRPLYRDPEPNHWRFDLRAYDHDLAPESSPRSPYPYLVDSEKRPIGAPNLMHPLLMEDKRHILSGKNKWIGILSALTYRN